MLAGGRKKDDLHVPLLGEHQLCHGKHGRFGKGLWSPVHGTRGIDKRNHGPSRFYVITSYSIHYTKLYDFSLNFLSAFWAGPPDKLAEALIITLQIKIGFRGESIFLPFLGAVDVDSVFLIAEGHGNDVRGFRNNFV